MPSDRFTRYLRWAGAVTMLLLIVMLMVEGTWAVGLYRKWPFVLCCNVAAVLLTVTIIREFSLPLLGYGFADRESLRTKKGCPNGAGKGLSHLGLLLVLLGGMLGSLCTQELQMAVGRFRYENYAFTANDRKEQLPFQIRLQDFRIDYYEDGRSPKQYTSEIEIEQKAKGKRQKAAVSVNHPLRYHGWWIYQENYDHQLQSFSVLKLVKDPFLPVVYAGFAFLLIGTLLQLRSAWGSWKIWPAVILLAAVFTWISLARIETKTLVPALRSLWFFPHILIYMLAYSLMAIALILSILQIVHKWYLVHGQIVHKLMSTTSSLLLIGMLFGSIWAKEAWGQYWTWDAKECWAAATWLIMVVIQHIPLGHNSQIVRAQRTKRTAWVKVLFLALAFLSMQITWYGVNYLPSAQYSMHTYNR